MLHAAYDTSKLTRPMVSRSKKSATPVTFDLPLDLLAKIEVCRENLGAESASEVIRAALDRFDFAGCHPVTVPHRQISVRLTVVQRTALKRYAKIKDVSVGVLLRMAVEDMPIKKPKVARKVTKCKKPSKR